MTVLHDIAKKVGGNVTNGGLRATVAGPGHSRKDRSLSLMMSGDRVVWHSFSGDVPESIRDHLGISAQPVSDLSKSQQAKLRKERRQLELADKFRKTEFCKAVWANSTTLKGSPAQAYLESRSLKVLPPDIRYNAKTPTDYSRKSHQPAMVALVRDPDGFPTGLHFTFLNLDTLENKRRMMVGTTTGGSIRLFPHSPTLAVAEGIETALSYAFLHNINTWAVLSTSGIRNFQPPLETQHLILAIDADDQSKAHPRGAALEIAETLKFPFCRTSIHAAPNGQDWNDVVRGF